MWLHGFTQTKDSSHEFLTILAGTYEVLTIDLPGHGRNAALPATLVDAADLLAAAVPDESFILGGYSFGARVALHVALRHPERLRGLALVSATAGLRDLDERAARRERDAALAERVEILGGRAFVDEWLAQPMFASLPDDPRERRSRSSYAPGLADALRLAGTGTQGYLGDGLRALSTPTVVIAGAKDPKFVAEAELLAAAIPNSKLAVVDDAGHAVHLERPVAVAALLENL